MLGMSSTCPICGSNNTVNDNSTLMSRLVCLNCSNSWNPKALKPNQLTAEEAAKSIREWTEKGCVPKIPSLGTNPKDLLGDKKVSITTIPSSAIILIAQAMMNGASRYGKMNWRENKVQGHIYIDATMRHLLAWFDGEEKAQDSGCHHLAHAAACLCILLDAIETGNLVDDRPVKGAAAQVLERINNQLKEQK